MNLSGRLLPAHPKPLDDELFSSWITRLAQSNGLKVQTFCQHALDQRYQLWNRDIDRSASPALLKELAEKTANTLPEIQALLLLKYEGKLFDKLKNTGIQKWILPLKIYHRKRLGYGQQFCPLCIKEDKTPYFRKRWRVGFYTFCVKHRCMLHDRCPNCNSPIMFHRQELGQPEVYVGSKLSVCTECGFDMVDSKAKEIQIIDNSSFQILKTLNQSLEQQIKLNLNLDQLRVLHHFCMLLVSPRFSPGVLGFLKQYFLDEILNFKVNNSFFENQNIQTRHTIIQLAIWIYSDWKKIIKLMCEKKAIKYNYLTRDFRNPPKWYLEYVGQFNRRFK